MDEGGEHHIELDVAREDLPKTLEASVELLVVRPRLEARDLGRDRGCEAEIHGQLPCFVALVGPIHEEGDLLLQSREAT